MSGNVRTLIDATSTPLASIFGSGFLVIVPILAGAVGRFSVLAMAAVCGLAYAVGSIIRLNIRYAEPLLEGAAAKHRTVRIERTSDLALILAYVISVTLYIRILAAFLFGGLGHDTPLNEHLLTVGVIAIIGVVGYLRGLNMLQRLEDWSLWITIAIILALLAGFGLFDLGAMRGDGIQLPDPPDHTWWESITIVAGALIVVQGFETSRYLGGQFDTATRIRSSRLSQIISTAVYLAFVGLATPLMHFLGDTVEDNALIMLAGKASVLLPIPLVVAAVLSQFSAAVADTMAGGGNAVEVTKGHVDHKHAYLFICGLAIVLSMADTMTILALASRAFAFYYTLQCIVAITISRSTPQRLGMGLVAAVLLFITIFAVPAG